MVDVAKNADLLVLECTLAEGKAKEGHLTPSECGKLAAEAQAKKLLLTHLSPNTKKKRVILQVKKFFSGTVLMARDGLPVCP
jgi:ribonuclease BN (tRNA processing enzyme)